MAARLTKKAAGRGSFKNVGIAFGVIAAAVGFGSLPMYFHNRHQRMNKALVRQEDGLTGSQIMRGPYVNSGSHDVGRDPDWDLKTGLYKGQSPLALVRSPYDKAEEQQ